VIGTESRLAHNTHTSSTAHRNFLDDIITCIIYDWAVEGHIPSLYHFFFTDRDFSFVVSFGQISVSIDEAHSKEKDRLPYYCCVAR
jgi:hypothetical protein